MRIISMQMGGHVGEVFRRLKEGVEQIEAEIPFSSDSRLGMLTFCPTNLGTTIRSVQCTVYSVQCTPPSGQPYQ